MSQRTESALFDEQEDHVDLRPLARFAGWGLAAVVAVGLTVIAARSDLGERRMSAAVGSNAVPADRWQLVITQLVARANDAEGETRRLSLALGDLSTERDKLAARLTTLERNIEDLTGAIAARPAVAVPPAGSKDTAKKADSDAGAKPSTSTEAAGAAQAVAPSQPPAQLTAAPAALPVAASPQVQSTPPSPAASPSPAPQATQAQVQITTRSQPVAAQPATREALGAITTTSLPPPPMADTSALAKATDLPNAQDNSADEVPLPRPSPAATPAQTAVPAAPERPATIPLNATRETAKPAPVRMPLGVDVGGATNLAGLRALWAKIQAISPPLLSELRPVIAIRDGVKPGAVQLRLVAGPLANAEHATRLCAALIDAGVTCHTAAYDGQRLASR